MKEVSSSFTMQIPRGIVQYRIQYFDNMLQGLVEDSGSGGGKGELLRLFYETRYGTIML